MLPQPGVALPIIIDVAKRPVSPSEEQFMNFQQQRGEVSKALLIALAVGAMLAGFWGGQYWLGDRPRVETGGPALQVPDGFPGTVLPGGKALPDFELQADDGQPFTPSSLKDKWTLLFFGYTHCPDVCPTTLGTLKNAWDALAKSAGGTDGVEVVFVSVDPERDTIEHLKEYVDYFDPAFTGVTGDADNLLRFSRALGAIYMKAKGSSEENYLVDHTAAIFVIDPSGRYAAVLSAPHDAGKIAAAVQALRGQ